jgi:putative phosphoesterase
MKIGIISDTHSYINPKVFSLFEGVELILHAGDIGTIDIITSLEALAPVKAICGNIDTFPLSTRYPQVLGLEIHGVGICIIHQFISIKNSIVQQAVAQLPNKKLNLVICGHSHEAKLQRVDQVLVFNPGSAGKSRFSLRPAVGMLTISEWGQYTPEIIYLDEK